MAKGRFNISGITNKLKKFNDNSTRIAINRLAAKKFLQLMSESYDNQRSPYGIQWKKKVIPNGYKILHSQRNRLKNSIKILRVSRLGFTVGTRVPYGKYHMSGTKKMVTRPFLLDSNRMPKKYQAAYSKIYKDYFKNMKVG